MADRWIITDRRYHHHPSLDSARTERERLKTLEGNAGKHFTIWRVKTNVRPSKNYSKAMELLRAAQQAVAAQSDPEALKTWIDQVFLPQCNTFLSADEPTQENDAA
jgi:hypothetical protein